MLRIKSLSVWKLSATEYLLGVLPTMHSAILKWSIYSNWTILFYEGNQSIKVKDSE